jgi:PAS domain S-box-containing protein
MKISLEKKILLGFIINLLVVIASGWIFVSRLNKQRDKTMDSTLDVIELSLFVLSVILLAVVYFIIRFQLRAKNISQNLLSENKQLLQSIIDNTSNPIFIKELNGEYLLINKEYESLFHISNEEIIGKTDHDFLPSEVATAYRNSDLEVVKALRELKTEETIEQPDGPHTYIAVKFPLYNSEGRIYAIGGISTDITERKTNEESLKSADKFFNLSLDIMVIASKDKFIKINPTMSKILGYSIEELLRQSFFTYVHPEDLEITQQEIEKLQSGIPTITFENRWICKDGTIKLLSWSATPDLSTGLLYAVAHDISMQKEMESSLKMANNFFNMSFDLLVVAKGDRFIKINPAYTKTLGYSQKDMDNVSFFTLSTNPKRSVEAVSKLAEGETMVNFTDFVICKDGSNKWLNWNATVDLQTGLMYGVARDITKMKADDEKLTLYNQKLKENEQQIQIIFDGAPDPVIVIDSESKIIKWNPKATTVFGWDTTEVIGKPLHEFIIPERHRESHKKGLEKFLKTGIGAVLNKTIEIEAVNKNGEEVPVALSISPVKMEDSYIFIGFIRDITESKKALDELYENEETLRLIIENIGEGVLVSNIDKKVVMANYMANEIYGIEEDHLIPTNIAEHFELYFPDEKTIFPSQNLPMERALKGEATDDVDIVLWNPNNKEKKRVLISGRPLIDQNKNVIGAVVTIKDISRYKQMEEELKETELKYRQLIGFKTSGDKAP